MLRPLASAITAFLLLLALLYKLHTILLCISNAFHAATTPVWRVETFYPVLLKLAASATTTIMLIRMFGLLVRVALGCVLRAQTPQRTKPTTPIIYVYPNIQFLNHPTHHNHPRCAICLCDGNNNAVLECGHAFHWGCVRPWLDAKNKCPLCARRQMRRAVDAEGRVVVEEWDVLP
jgi:hypothetical protein